MRNYWGLDEDEDEEEIDEEEGEDEVEEQDEEMEEPIEVEEVDIDEYDGGLCELSQDQAPSPSGTVGKLAQRILQLKAEHHREA